MIDKEWLERILIAFKIYKESNPQSEEIEKFIKWLYEQYGITYPKERKK